jgi:hypothetical protein
MLDKIAAVELRNYAYNQSGYSYGDTIENLTIIDVQIYAKNYVAEHCSHGDTVDSIFSWETIAYTYGLLQGLKEND